MNSYLEFKVRFSVYQIFVKDNLQRYLVDHMAKVYLDKTVEQYQNTFDVMKGIFLVETTPGFLTARNGS